MERYPGFLDNPFAISSGIFGGAKGSRTPDLLNAIQALYQLSYGPTGGLKRLCRLRGASYMGGAK